MQFFFEFVLFATFVSNKRLRTSLNQKKKTQQHQAIRQEGESQNGGYMKTKHAKFSEKHFFPHWYAHAQVFSCEFFGIFKNISGGSFCRLRHFYVILLISKILE